MRRHIVPILAAALMIPVAASAQTPQSLFERGAYSEVTERVQAERAAGQNDPVSAYLAGLAFDKLNRHQDARTEFARLTEGGDETWHAIGQSAIALLDNALDEAVNEGRRARDLSGESGYANFQLGLALLRQNAFDEASQALDRAAELMPQFAYAHYHAGVAHQREKRFSRMAEHFQIFLKLAPDAPERRQVQLALSALRG
ncbi:MAG: tetratricopeptide repeat protein [Vicinamibacterales bacterium]